MTRKELIEAIARMLELANDRALKMIYQFVLHLI